MAKFIMRRMAPGMAQGKAAGKRYPHLLRLMTVKTGEVVESAARNTTFSKEELRSAISVLAETIAWYAADGYTVQLDGLGTFRARLSLREGAPEEREGDTSQRTGASVEVSGLTFKPDKELLLQANLHGRFERISDRRWYNYAARPEAERRERLRSFLEENTVCTVRDYARLSGLLRTAAGQELRRMAKEPGAFIERRGAGASLVYVLAKPREEQAEENRENG